MQGAKGYTSRQNIVFDIIQIRKILRQNFYSMAKGSHLSPNQSFRQNLTNIILSQNFNKVRESLMAKGHTFRQSRAFATQEANLT